MLKSGGITTGCNRFAPLALRKRLNPTVMIKIKYKILLIAAFVLVGTYVIFIFLIDAVPPKPLTHGAIHMSKRRVLRYAHQNNKLPENLEILPEIPGKSNRIKDAWGRKLIYIINHDNTITLISYGKDGIINGEGDNKDMIGIFYYKKKNGRWEDELCNWINDPFKN